MSLVIIIAKIINNDMDFRLFLENSEETDIKKTLAQIPASHSRLIRGYKIKFEPGNTLKGDKNHVGFIDEKRKTITIASPWNYSRSFTLLHEVAHAVWKYLMNDQMKKKWQVLVQKYKNQIKAPADALNQDSEEIFAMSYASTYAKHKVITYYRPVWVKFIKSLPN